MSLDIKTTRYRLNLILDYLDELRPLAAMTLDEFLQNRYGKRAAERILEIMIQAAIDINNHLVTQIGQISGKSNADLFLELSRIGAITSDLSIQLSESGKFRNRLAHQYDKVDPAIVFDILNEALDQYRLYVQQVSGFLDSVEETNV
jgi:uncharacterized protein YutE (UPF0331/DUF86 family)